MAKQTKYVCSKDESHPEVVERVAPNDTVPVGICPGCWCTVYLPDPDAEE